MPRRRRNPQQFTIDEAQTATLIATEGNFYCVEHKRKAKIYRYPVIEIGMCVREALDPASRTFRTPIHPVPRKEIVCRPELFPPDGRGNWRVRTEGKPATRIMERLKPLIPPYHMRRWQALLQKCR